MNRGPGSPAASPSLRVQGLALAALAVAAYLPSLRNGFVFDDQVLLVGSPLVRGPLWPYWFSARPLDYQPVSYTLLWLAWRAFGIWAPGYHALDLAGHVAVVLLFWRVLGRLGAKGAWLGAALFAVHPVAVPSVAWISETRNVVSAALALLAFDLWLRDDEAPSARRRVAALGTFALALLAKASVVVLPVVFLLVAGWWRRGRVSRADAIRAAPFFVLALISGLVTIWFQWAKAMVDLAVFEEPLALRAIGAGRAIAFYVWKGVLPSGLMLLYPRWALGWTLPDLMPAVALLGALGACWALRHRTRGPFAFLAYVVVATLPVSGIIPMAWHRMSRVSDHLQYLALMGACAALAGAVAGVTARLRAAPPLTGALSFALLAFFGSTTVARSLEFQSDDVLWLRNLASNPASEMVHVGLASVYRRRGDVARAQGELLEAARLSTDPAEAHLDRGQVALERGMLEDAAAEFEAANRLSPSRSGGARGLAECLDRLGRRAEAKVYLRAASTRVPDDPDVRAQLGVLLAHDGDLVGAIRELGAAVELRPGDMILEQRLAVLLVAAGRRQEALVHVARALGAGTSDAEAHARLAAALLEAGLGAEAAIEESEARRPTR